MLIQTVDLARSGAYRILAIDRAEAVRATDVNFRKPLKIRREFRSDLKERFRGAWNSDDTKTSDDPGCGSSLVSFQAVVSGQLSVAS